MARHAKIIICIALVFSFLSSCKTNRESEALVPIIGVKGENGMVVSAHPLASEVGIEVLKQGGNAYDAAIAVQYALAVVYPIAGNIGGGGFAVIRTEDGRQDALDFREKAPKKAFRDMYLDAEGNVKEGSSTLGHLSVGVPGTVDGMVQLHERYGTMEIRQLIQPAIDLAENGFELTEKEAERLNEYRDRFVLVNESEMKLISDSLWEEGDVVKLKSLSKTLRRIRDYGRDGFYKGVTASLLISECESGGGIISQQDLDEYESVWRKPIEGLYKGHTVISMPPPSSGGIALLQLLEGVESHDIGALGHNTTSSAHLMAELERRVYADRARYLGDPDFYDVPVDGLLNAGYLDERFSDISMNMATPSEEVFAGERIKESPETTHFSIVDKEGNAVSITTTLNGAYGSKVMVDGAGFFLNNEMDDFSVKPGVPNMYGLVGGEANAIEPKKRMLSSMTPTIVEKDGELFMVLGTPGGSTIITSVFQTILNVVDHDMNLDDAVKAGRVHHQWLPDEIKYEWGGMTAETEEGLRALGHALNETLSIGKVDAILRNSNGILNGAGDPRGDDTAIGY